MPQNQKNSRLLITVAPGVRLPKKEEIPSTTRIRGRKQTPLYEYPPLVELVFQKKHLPGRYLGLQMIWDSSDKIEQLKSRARGLSLPEEAKIQAVLRLVREALKFPYDSHELERYEKAGHWVGADGITRGKKSEILSEIIECGFGRCRHFASLYEILGTEAKLVVNMLGGKVTNFVRADTNQPAFRTMPVGSAEPHSWNEVYLTEQQRWIPVDPTVDICGFDEALLEQIKENYSGVDNFSFLLEIPDGWKIPTQKKGPEDAGNRHNPGDGYSAIFYFDDPPVEPVEFNFTLMSARSLVDGMKAEIVDDSA